MPFLAYFNCTKTTNTWLVTEFEDEAGQSMMLDFQAAQANYDKLEQLKSNLIVENTKVCIRILDTHYFVSKYLSIRML